LGEWPALAAIGFPQIGWQREIGWQRGERHTNEQLV
jgi:hypothetical protein